AVPPLGGPKLGLMEPRVGGSLYVKPAASVALCPSGLVTTTSLAPGVPAGAGAVIWVARSEARFIPVAAVPPMVTVAPGRKLLPLRVTAVPPLRGPLVGLMALSVGAGALYVKPAASVTLCPSGLVTTTAWAPGVPAGVRAVIWVA